MEQRLNIVISGSRYSYERAIIIKALEDKGFDNLDIYDCESKVTDVQYAKWDPLSPENQIYDFTEKEIREVTAKQLQINETILNCDWFIFVAPTNFYGKWTYMEWKVMLNAIRVSGKKRVLSVIRCENYSDSVKDQEVSDIGEYSFSDFENLQKQILDIENYYVTYKYDSNFSDLKNKFSEEIYKVKIQNMVMRLISKPRKELMPSDIFKNVYRTEPGNGFDENFYLPRTTVDGVLENQSQRSFTVVLGAPASGKTRAVYEFLKHSHTVSDDARIIILNRRNIEEVIEHLKNYKNWHRGLRKDDQAKENLSNYYFVCDQIFDEINNADDISLWWKLYDIAVYKFGACILATSLIEEYENNKSSLFVSDDIRYNEIRISNLSDEADSRFSDRFREHFSDMLQEEGEGPTEPAADLFDPFQSYDMNENTLGESVILRKQVIGDYIRGLVDYHESILRMITDYDRSHNDIIKNFTKSFNIIKLYRHISNVPVGLVLAVFNKISSESISQETYEEFKDFCLRNNILTIKNSGGFDREYIENGAIYDYDKEKVMIPLSPNFLIEIRNDYIWMTIREKYMFSLENPESMEDCMEYYCRAFFNETPVNTLKRIIARSPSVRFSIDLRGHENFVRQYVCKEVNALCHNRYGIQYDKNEMNELIAYILHRSNNIHEFKNDYNTFTGWVGNDFKLTEEIVGELMGFGIGKTTYIKNQVKNFLKVNRRLICQP